MGSCKKCVYYNFEHDEFRQSFVDAIKDNGNEEKHFCSMYINHIPETIFAGETKCVYKDEKRSVLLETERVENNRKS
jgi:hypothetical protein